MTHLPQNLTVTADDALDRIVRPVRIVRRLHSRFIRQRINVLERHLPVGEQLTREFLADHKLALAVAYRDSIFIPDRHPLEPRRVCGSHTGRHHLRDVPVDVIAEQSRGVFGHLPEFTVRQQTRLHKCLETIAYS